MGICALRIPIGIAVLVHASGASAQVDPAFSKLPPGASAVAISWTEIPLRDRDGTLVTMSYGRLGDGSGVIRFVGGDGRPVAVVSRGRGSPAPSGGGSSNPLTGMSFPPLPDTSTVGVPRLPSPRGGLPNERSDTGSELRHLVARVNDLTKQVEMLTSKLDAAARKR